MEKKEGEINKESAAKLLEYLDTFTFDKSEITEDAISGIYLILSQDYNKMTEEQKIIFAKLMEKLDENFYSDNDE